MVTGQPPPDEDNFYVQKGGGFGSRRDDRAEAARLSALEQRLQAEAEAARRGPRLTLNSTDRVILTLRTCGECRLLSDRDVHRHEGAHGSAFVIHGVIPLAIRCDAPRPDMAGAIVLPWDEIDILKDEAQRMLLTCTLAPAALSGDLRDEWPIVPADWDNGCRGDARWARSLCGFLGFGQVDYLRHAERARRLTGDGRYCRLLFALVDALEANEGLLVRNEIAAIAKEVADDATTR